MVLTQLLYSANEAAVVLAEPLSLLRRDNVSSCNATQPEEGLSPTLTGVFGTLVPILVLLSGLFAGLTLGYMSLDETQLSVLAISGTEQQKKYAKKIIPIRKNGHLLLITLILANMIANETLPVVADKVFKGGIVAVVASTALIVIFSEIIPQTICTRYGLVIGAKMAVFVRVLIFIFYPIAWPVSKLLELMVGPHHGIIYRRSELKELIAMHADDHPHGQGQGELKHDTAAIIGHTLDLQEKVVKDAMTSIEKVFMLSIDEKLDYATLTRIHQTGHSRIPVYTQVDGNKKGEKFRKIIGILLVKQCVLLDPEDATPLRSIPLNKVPVIAYDEPLLNVLDRFQEGRSHMAIVSKYSSKRAASVKEVVKPALTKRFLNRFRDSDSSSDEDDLEKGCDKDKKQQKKQSLTVGKPLEQTMPADALLPKANAEKFLQGLDQFTNPMGIITLEDVLEELIGEEILDEFDLKGAQALAASTYMPPEAAEAVAGAVATALPVAPPQVAPPTPKSALSALKVPKLPGFGMGMMRTRSAPGTPRGGTHVLPGTAAATGAAAGPPITIVTGPALETSANPTEDSTLQEIKEVSTPSTTGKTLDDNEKEDEKLTTSTTAGSGTTATATTTTKDGVVRAPEASQVTFVTAVDRTRSSSTPPSPHPPAAGLPTAPGAAANPLFTGPGKSNAPAPSLLTEAVLRGRQARVGGGGTDGTATPGRSSVKGRFKSTPLALEEALAAIPTKGDGTSTPAPTVAPTVSATSRVETTPSTDNAKQAKEKSE